MLKDGLYEQVISKKISNELACLENKLIKKSPIDIAEGAKALTNYISELIEKRLIDVTDNSGDIDEQIVLVNKIIDIIKDETEHKHLDELKIDAKGEELLALFTKTNSIYSLNENLPIIRPESSLSQTSLFTGSIHEPQMFSELKKEILSCDRIDMLVSFIKWSGLRLIINELAEFTQKGGKLRVITTSYMGATDVKAIEELQNLINTEIRISYDTKRTRLHAKAYIFYRETDFTTAYVGSSNLSNAAISSGLEWNVKVAQKDLPETIKKISATFESYWNSNEFEKYSHDDKEKLNSALNSEKYSDSEDNSIYSFNISPYPYQQEILDKLESERTIHNHYRNLVVAATGTGKTVISAFDYKNFCKKNNISTAKILFVAHREEILKQSIFCFRGVLKDANFGDLFVGSYKPESLEQLFVSVQTFNSQNLIDKTSPDFYDYIIVDEFHHAAAPTYQKLLTYYTPKVLLGLTATPERMDGKNILEYFDNRIAAEIRLPEAIERKLLCPFQYFGVTDNIDLTSLKWMRGGYDKTELSNVYTLSGTLAKMRVNLIINALSKYVTSINDVKGLGFCVSKEHAKFMCESFNLSNIPSIYLVSETSDDERNTAKQKLVDGLIKFIFVVDIYNEGVDIPEINTVLFLRPTESLTIFLQQLGRGLRLNENKECLTVLDFIGQANKKYNFENKFMVLLSDTEKGIQQEIKKDFISLPKGCYIQLERKAKEYVLSNIRESISARSGLISKIATFEEDSSLPLSIENFVEYHHITLQDIYSKDNFSRLCVDAGMKDNFNEIMEEDMTKAFKRICAINSRKLIIFLQKTFKNLYELNITSLSASELKMLQMFQFTVWQKSFEACGFSSLKEGLLKIRESKIMYEELIDLLKYNLDHIDFVDENVNIGFECPLDLYCNYTRDQILVALDFMKPATVREGVKYLSDKKVDILFVTLNKSDKDYSPSTMYNDYSINENLFHWQSQSTTSEVSPTGQRYIHHRGTDNKVLLFVREFKNDSLGAAPYSFLGIAYYVSHEGSRPMNVTWRLEKPIPAKFLRKTNKLMFS